MTARAEPATADGFFVFDGLRAAAALAVLLAHGRSFLMLDAAAQPPLSPIGQLFYGLSGLGHQAVIVFFVVSGALVTRMLMGLDARGRLGLVDFAVPRLVRLWIVLLPCLLLGGALDGIGMTFGDDLVYAGRYGALRPSATALPISLDAATFSGNLLFLQTIAVPPFGTNVPLWSLANEAWYYAAAYLIVALRHWRSGAVRAGIHGTILFGIAVAVMTPTLWTLAPTWIVGAVVGGILRRCGPRLPRMLPCGVALATLVTALVLARVTAARNGLLGDYAVAVATGLVILAVGRWAGPGGVAATTTRAVAQISYSLYLSHFPLMACVAALAFNNRRMPFGLPALLALAAVLLLALGVAALVWWLFERRTKPVQHAIQRHLRGLRNGSAAVAARGAVP